MSGATQTSDPFREFGAVAHNLFGVYHDSLWGYKLVSDQAKADLSNAKLKPGARLFLMFEPRPDAPERPAGAKMTDKEMFDSTTNMGTAEQIIQRTGDNGRNSTVVAQMTLTTLYHYWEDRYRAVIAAHLGLSKKEDLNVDAMGDIRLLRNSIVHNNSVAKKEVERAKRFRWFRKGEFIELTYDQLLEIKNYIVNELRDDCIAAGQLAKT